MTKDNKYRIGDGPRQIPVWLRTEEPVVLDGLDEYPKAGDRYEIGNELWRVVEVSDRVVLTQEPS
jgi:hypothetical protein